MRQFVTVGRITYEVVRPGCATGSESCPNREPLTVYRLGDKGARRFHNLTECIDGTDITFRMTPHSEPPYYWREPRIG